MSILRFFDVVLGKHKEVTSTDGLPVKMSGNFNVENVNVDLSSLEERVDKITAGETQAIVRNGMKFYGANINNRPDADKVPVGAFYISIQTQDVWQSDGSSWAEA